MNWILLSVLSAFGQALGWAIKKKALDNKGLNNTLGAISFAVAAVCLLAFFRLTSGSWWHGNLNDEFWQAAAWVIVLNIVAVFCMYRAIDIGINFSALMPFLAVTALAVVPIEYWLRNVLPQWQQVAGIAVIVTGAVVFNLKRIVTPKDARAYGYFAVTALCYSFAPVWMRTAVVESGSGVFAAMVFHFGIAMGFLALMFITREQRAISSFRTAGQLPSILFTMVLAGTVTALLENGPSTVALQTANASEVIALKRLMPIFALAIGYIYFKERNITRNMLAGTTLLILGSFLVTWFQG